MSVLRGAVTGALLIVSLVLAPSVAAQGPERPTNDDFASAEAIALDASRNPSLDGATVESGEPAHAGKAANRSVWYRLTPASDGVVTIDFTADDASGDRLDGVIAAYTGDELSSIDEVGSSDSGQVGSSESSLRIEVDAGETYSVAVDVAGQTPVDQSFLDLAYIGNDDLEDATAIGAATGFVDEISIYGATHEAAEPEHDQDPSRESVGSVWFRWTAPEAGAINFSVADAQSDTILGIYEGEAVDSLVEVASAGFGGRRGDASFVATEGQSYAIAIDAAYDQFGSRSLRWGAPQPPNTRITDKPKPVLRAKRPVKVGFRFSGTPSAESFECKLDSGAWKRCRSPQLYTAKPARKPKRHSFQVRAIDEVGLVDRSPAKAAFRLVKREKVR